MLINIGNYKYFDKYVIIVNNKYFHKYRELQIFS
jgi:hypothetical protein